MNIPFSMNVPTDKIPYLFGTVSFASSLALEGIALILSNALGINFKKDTEGLYEEIPAYYANVLGLRLAIMPANSEQPEYVLDVLPRSRIIRSDLREEINITAFLETLLSKIEEIQIT